jgi:hypothetical protein
MEKIKDWEVVELVSNYNNIEWEYIMQEIGEMKTFSLIHKITEIFITMEYTSLFNQL